MNDSLDPSDWRALHEIGHEILDTVMEYIRTVESRPVWQDLPGYVQSALSESPPEAGMSVGEIWNSIKRILLPYSLGNLNPRFFGWVHGAGTPVGVLAEMIAAAVNANVGGREHAPIYFERQVLDWCRTIFGFPSSSGGILTSGTSMANVIGLALARGRGTDQRTREGGLYSSSRQRVYASTEAHVSIRKALELLGMGSQALVEIPTDETYRMRSDLLRERIAVDRESGFEPVCIVGSAGTVNTGAVDDLRRLGEICQEENLWFHVDGAFGAAVRLSEKYRNLVDGIEEADSLAFDFHKWFHVPYDVGCLMTRDMEELHKTFGTEATYLLRQERGAGSGIPWFADHGPELSRGFRALKVWFTWKAHGTRGFAEAIEANIRQAKRLARLVDADADLELMAPTTMNIVCFRYCPSEVARSEWDAFNTNLVVRVQESGHTVPSTAHVDGGVAVRAAIINHRTKESDVEILIDVIKSVGQTMIQERSTQHRSRSHE